MGQFKSFHCSFISLFGGLRIRIGYLLAGDAGLVCSGCSISGLVSGSVVCSSEVVDCCCLAVIVSSLSSASGIAGVGFDSDRSGLWQFVFLLSCLGLVLFLSC